MKKQMTKNDELFVTFLCITMVVLYFVVVVILGSIFF